MGSQQRSLDHRRMILKLLLLLSLLILSTSQEDDDDAGNKTAEHVSVSQPTSSEVESKGGNLGNGQHVVNQRWMSQSTFCVYYGCRVDRYPQTWLSSYCRYSHVICRWNYYLETGWTLPLPSEEAVQISPDVNKRITAISLRYGWCENNGCPVQSHSECCYSPTCRQRRPSWCNWMHYLREGNMQNLSSNSLRNPAGHTVTLCDPNTGYSQTLGFSDPAQVTPVFSVDCAFMSHGDDPVADCFRLARYCNHRQYSPVTVASHNYKWCLNPRNGVGTDRRNFWKLEVRKDVFGVCCYHPYFRREASQCYWTAKI